MNNFLNNENDNVLELFNALQQLGEADEEIVEITLFFKIIYIIFLIIYRLITSMFEENSPPFTKMLTDLKGDVSIVKEIVKVALGTSDHTAASLMLAILDSLPIPSPETIRFIRSHRDALRREIIELLSDGGILIFPSHPTVAPYHNKPLFCYFDFNYTSLFSALRLPVVVCPLGLNSEGLPTSVQIVGAPNSDKLLCAVASDLEEGFNGWKPPRGTKNEYD